MMVNSIIYLVGVLGGIGGLFSTITEIFGINPKVGLVILLSSIALLWVGVLIESVEESYIQSGA